MGTDQDRSQSEKSTLGKCLEHPCGGAVCGHGAAGPEQCTETFDLSLVLFHGLPVSRKAIHDPVKRWPLLPNVGLSLPAPWVGILEIDIRLSFDYFCCKTSLSIADALGKAGLK
jgi:hypothetical protein